jgi:hypothetical protein
VITYRFEFATIVKSEAARPGALTIGIRSFFQETCHNITLQIGRHPRQRRRLTD